MRDLERGEEPPEESATTAPRAAQQPESKQAKPEAQESRPSTTPTPSQAEQQVAVKPTVEKAEKAEQPKQMPWVSASSGLHRIYWDLRSQGPVRWESAQEFKKGPKSGALVPPGEYTATITVAGQTATEKFEVVNDPRSHVSAADLQAQYDAAERAIHQLSQLDAALNRLDAIKSQLNALQQAVKGTPDEQPVKTAGDQLRKQMDAVEEKITSNPEAQESTLRKALAVREYVGGMNRLLEDSDQAPTPAVLEEQERVKKDYTDAVQAFNNFISSEVAAFNSAMNSRKLPGVIAGEPVQP